MTNRNVFRASSQLQVVDSDAGRKPLTYGDKTQDKLRVEQLAEQIGELQNLLYAEHGRKILIILQGMDTSGKDGTVRGVFGRIDPLGVRCVGFKAPSLAEREHDFLWRVHQQVPGNGEIVIFNRSHYEDVLISRVHGWIDEPEYKRRYAHIRHFERMLADTGTVLLKFFLHISKDEQKQRLQARIDDPGKHWKFDPKDLDERQHWDSYQHAYQEAIIETDADNAPWYIIPSDSKTHRNLAVATVLHETMAAMQLAVPAPNHDLQHFKIV